MCNHDDKNLTNKTNKRTARTFTSRVNVHVLRVEGALGLGGHVVIGVVSLHHALDVAVLVVVKLYSVMVNFICSQIVAHFETGHLWCCLYSPRRLQ